MWDFVPSEICQLETFQKLSRESVLVKVEIVLAIRFNCFFPKKCKLKSAFRGQGGKGTLLETPADYGKIKGKVSCRGIISGFSCARTNCKKSVKAEQMKPGTTLLIWIRMTSLKETTSSQNSGFEEISDNSTWISRRQKLQFEKFPDLSQICAHIWSALCGI